MVATRGQTFKRPWRRSCHSSNLKSSTAPIARKDSWRFHAVGSSNAPLLGSTAAEGSQRIGRTSTATRWRSCGLPQSASCSENFVIPPDVFGQTLRGYLSVDTLAELANRALSAAGYQVWVLLDRLDVAFAESHELERNALRALFRVYRDFADKDCIKLKIFLRSDIWDRIVEGGFREASHITRVVTLDWTSEALLNLIVRRLLSNEMLIDKLEIDKVAVLRDSKAQDAVFYRFFPPQVEQGAKKRPTRDWMINRCEDGHWKTAPRELIHFLNSLRDLELARLERGDALPPGEQLFDRSVFKPALEIVSEARVVQTIYAEYPNLKPYLVELEGEKTEQTIDTLATIWKVSKGEADKRAQALVEIGFFEQRGGRDNWTYWVPFLYRDALHMSQGLAEE